MAEFDDDRMKEIFGKLRGYDSATTGISWGSVEKRLPTKALRVGGKAFLALLIPASMIVWLTVDNPAMLADSVESAARSTNTELPQSSSAQQPQVQNAPASAVSSQLANPNLMIERESGPPTASGQAVRLAEPLHVNDVELVIEPVAIQTSSQTPATVVEEIPQSPAVTINSADSSAMTATADTRKARRNGFSLDVFYLFGIVDPLKGDNNIVQDYISKPGFGFSGSINIPVRQRNTLYIVPSLNVLYKPYDFEVVEYGDESISIHRKAGQSLAAYAGVGVMWNVRTWQGGAAFHVGAGKEDILFSSTLLSLSMKKDLVPVAKDRLLVTISGSVMLPVTGSGEYLKYTPITVGVGIRRP